MITTVKLNHQQLQALIADAAKVTADKVNLSGELACMATVETDLKGALALERVLGRHGQGSGQ